ncbi:MAG: hypothetical protein INR63_12845 [Actinomycetospora chiangmaiensis]|nr:hypothetical protein [Actinomycetospora chiangmaiensis]
MVTPPVYRQPLDGTEMVRVLKDGRWYLAPVTAIAALYDASGLTARLAADEAALAQETAARQAADASEASARAGGDATEAVARSAADAAATGRLTALEARPEEVAHFTASAKLPALSALGPVTLTLTGLVPAKANDVLKAGETVQVEPATPLPAGINLSAAVVTADGTVSLQLTASLSLAAGAAPIVWNISALR